MQDIALFFSPAFYYDASDQDSRKIAYEKAAEFAPKLKKLALSSGGELVQQKELIITETFVETAKLFHAQVKRRTDTFVAYLENPKYVKVVVGIRR